MQKDSESQSSEESCIEPISNSPFHDSESDFKAQQSGQSSSYNAPTGEMDVKEEATAFSEGTGAPQQLNGKRKRRGKTREEKNQAGKEYRVRRKKNLLQMQQDLFLEMKTKEDLEALLQRMMAAKNQVIDALRIVARSRYPEAFGEDSS